MIKGLLEAIFSSAVNTVDKKKKEKWDKMTPEEQKNKNIKNLIGGLLITIILILLAIISINSQ